MFVAVEEQRVSVYNLYVFPWRTPLALRRVCRGDLRSTNEDWAVESALHYQPKFSVNRHHGTMSEANRRGHARSFRLLQKGVQNYISVSSLLAFFGVVLSVVGVGLNCRFKLFDANN